MMLTSLSLSEKNESIIMNHQYHESHKEYKLESLVETEQIAVKGQGAAINTQVYRLGSRDYTKI
jgi:hypothetical protein